MDSSEAFAAIPDALRQWFVSTVRTGYARADDRFNEAEGSNGHTYGTDLYNMTWKGLSETADLGDLDVQFMDEHGRKRLRFGKAVLGCYRLGAFVPPNVLTDVQAAPAVTRRRAKQLGLPYPGRSEEEFDFADPNCTMVIGHYGNSEDGCLGIYLQIPATENAKDGLWNATQSLWLPGQELGDVAGVADTQKPAVATEAIQPPVVRRKKKGGSA